MTLYPPVRDSEETARRRRRAVRTAGWVAVAAVVVYVGFILLGVFGR